MVTGVGPPMPPRPGPRKLKNPGLNRVNKGKQVDLEIQGVHVQKVFTSQHMYIKKCRIARVRKEGVKYVLRDVKTVPNLNGPDQKFKWSTIKHEYPQLKELEFPEVMQKQAQCSR